MTTPNIKETKRQRFQFLLQLYEMSGVDESYIAKMAAFASVFDYDEAKIKTIVQYLGNEGLIRDFSSSNRELRSKGVKAPGLHDDFSSSNREFVSKGSLHAGPDDFVTITHKGIKEVEQAIENPQLPTEHFPPNIIYIMGNVSNSPIQQASNHGYQSVNINEKRLEELKEIIESLNKMLKEYSIEGEKKEELKAETKTIEAQMSSPRPKIEIIKDSLSYSKMILDGISGTLPLVTRITTWLNGLI